MVYKDDLFNTALMRATEVIACGLSRAKTVLLLERVYAPLTKAEREEIIRDAFVEACEQGVEYEDMDPSWFRG